MSIDGSPQTGIKRSQFPVTTLSMVGGSTPLTAMPNGTSIFRVEFPVTSVPTIFSLREARSAAGTVVAMRKSGGTNSTVALTGATSTSAGGFVFVPDMACASFIKFMSSHTMGAKAYTFNVFAWG